MKVIPSLPKTERVGYLSVGEGDDLQSTTSASTTVLLDKAKELKAFFKLASEDLSSSGQNSNSSFNWKK